MAHIYLKYSVEVYEVLGDMCGTCDGVSRRTSQGKVCHCATCATHPALNGDFIRVFLIEMGGAHG